MPEMRMPQRHKIKKSCRAPQPGPRNLQQENQIGRRRLTARNTRRGLGGFGHLAKYTAVQAAPGFSNWRDVPNRFARFKFFASNYLKKRPAGKQSVRTLNEAHRRERRDGA